jgi:toxin ParE1/3/4
MKRLVVQRRAMRDLSDARAYYRQPAPHRVSDFAQTMDLEFARLREHSGTGSRRYGLQVGISGLRNWPVKQFPYMIFYIERERHILVLRVLHQASDTPAHLDE